MMNPVAIGGCGQFRLPFIESESMESRPNNSYFQMLSHYFCPYFTLRSFSFLFIVITFLCLIIPQFLFPSASVFQNKLFPYTAIPSVYLNPIEVKYVNHGAIYKAFTTLFFHLSYTHWLGNLFGIYVSMFTMEFCWPPSILFMVVGGVVSCAYSCLTMNNMLMGFSGVIAASVGMFIGMFIGNWNYIMTRHSQMVVTWGLNCFFIFMLLFSNDPRSTMVHFIALGIGIVYGVAWIPKLGPDRCQSITGMVCKVLSVVITVLPFVIIFMHPTTGVANNMGNFGMPGQQNLQGQWPYQNNLLGQFQQPSKQTFPESMQRMFQYPGQFNQFQSQQMPGYQFQSFPQMF